MALEDGSVACVEIERQTVSCVRPDGSTEVIAHTGGGPNGLAIGPGGAMYVCNNGGYVWQTEGEWLRPVDVAPDYAGGRIERVDPSSGEVRLLYDRCDARTLCAPNDLVFDTHGGFYFTDTGQGRHRIRIHGAVYYARADGSGIAEVIHPILTPNGVGLSPDGSVLYVAETETARLWAFDLVEPGVIRKQPFPSPHGGRLVIGLEGFQRLDSLAVAESGQICIATLVSGCITVVAADGRLVRQVPMPDPYPTNICFGGADRRTAFVTLALTGKLAVLDWPEPGLKPDFALARTASRPRRAKGSSQHDG